MDLLGNGIELFEDRWWSRIFEDRRWSKGILYPAVLPVKCVYVSG